MGFDLQIFRYVLDAKRAGADFGTAATLGRQNLHVDRRTFIAEAKRFGLAPLAAQADAVFAGYPYVDELMRLLGAAHPASIDASDYEGATHIFDMNGDPPAALEGAFSLIVDGGTLEHVFDFPRAVRNVAKLLKTGGTFISINGSNNFMGHGFYQFSPELFYRVFSPENGFTVESMVVTEVNDDAVWYEVTDPAIVKRRVQLVNNARTYLMMRARKVESVELFKTPPQQSDYHDASWKDSESAKDQSFLRRPLIQRVVDRYLPLPARLALRRARQATRNHFSAVGYQRRTF
jgi:SAM-dependent methyltransferase